MQSPYDQIVQFTRIEMKDLRQRLWGVDDYREWGVTSMKRFYACGDMLPEVLYGFTLPSCKDFGRVQSRYIDHFFNYTGFKGDRSIAVHGVETVVVSDSRNARRVKYYQRQIFLFDDKNDAMLFKMSVPL